MLVKRNSPQPKSNVFKPADSPFFELFQQNRVPSLNERGTIQDLIAEKRAHLSHLNSHVPKRRPGKKHKVPTELRAELAYTRRFLEFHRAFVAPWRQLPVEIMSEIFLFTLKARKHKDGEPANDDRAGTMLLCRVCSTWRAIALKTPGLWDTLYIFLSSPFDPPDYAWVSTWLARSRSSAVYLLLFWDDLARTDTINSVVSIFVSHLHHTAELGLLGDSDDELACARLTFKPSVDSLTAPLLSTLDIHLPEGSVREWIDAACRASPCLARLRTTQSCIDFPILNLARLGWFYPTPMSRLFQILEDAPSLRHLDIVVRGPVAPSSAKSRLTMGSILKLEITSYDQLGGFLEQTEFPSVVNLRICHVNIWPNSTFHSSLSRWSCALTTLDFHKCTLSAEQIVTCLQHRACNTLESFSVRACRSRKAADGLFQYLTYHGPRQRLCNPSLKTIRLHEIRAKDGLLSAMVEFRARCSTALLSSGEPVPAQLREVQFSFWPAETQQTDHPEDWKRLQRMEKMAKRSELEIGWPDIVSAA